MRPTTPEDTLRAAERCTPPEPIGALRWSEYNRKFNALLYGGQGGAR
jgi:hypothetical protein